MERQTTTKAQPSAKSTEPNPWLHRTVRPHVTQRTASTLQPKLAISQPGDVYEQEADRVADQVLRMPDPTIQRACGPCSSGGGTCPKCAGEKQEPRSPPLFPPVYGGMKGGRVQGVKGIQRQSKSATTDHSVSDNFISGLSSGRPLDSATRAFFEPRFGTDFSHVRVHTDSRAAESARSVNALAYTVGRDVVFGAGQYAPGSSEGKRLMAHELTHVVQQGIAGKTPFTLRKVQVQRSPIHLQRLGTNPGCTDPESRTIHQAIFNARGWLKKAIPKLEESPLSSKVLSSLRRNFGSTYGVAVNAPLIVGRLRTAYREISTIPFRCVGVADATCARGVCGYADGGAGGHSATICTNVTLVAGASAIHQAGCVLHESLHAAFSRFTVDEYSGWHGASSSTPTYPGTGTDPLLNADSYTTLTMDLS